VLLAAVEPVGLARTRLRETCRRAWRGSIIVVVVVARWMMERIERGKKFVLFEGGGWSKGRARLAFLVDPSPLGLSVGDPSSGRLCRVGRVEAGGRAGVRRGWVGGQKEQQVMMSED